MDKKKDGREEFTLIFSRSAVSSLDNAIGEGGKVSAETIRKLRARAESENIQRASPENKEVIGKGHYVIWVQNQNPRENKELIFGFGFSHRGAQEK